MITFGKVKGINDNYLKEELTLLALAGIKTEPRYTFREESKQNRENGVKGGINKYSEKKLRKLRRKIMNGYNLQDDNGDTIFVKGWKNAERYQILDVKDLQNDILDDEGNFVGRGLNDKEAKREYLRQFQMSKQHLGIVMEVLAENAFQIGSLLVKAGPKPKEDKRKERKVIFEDEDGNITQLNYNELLDLQKSIRVAIKNIPILVYLSKSLGKSTEEKIETFSGFYSLWVAGDLFSEMLDSDIGDRYSLKNIREQYNISKYKINGTRRYIASRTTFDNILRDYIIYNDLTFKGIDKNGKNVARYGFDKSFLKKFKKGKPTSVRGASNNFVLNTDGDSFDDTEFKLKDFSPIGVSSLISFLLYPKSDKDTYDNVKDIQEENIDDFLAISDFTRTRSHKRDEMKKAILEEKKSEESEEEFERKKRRRSVSRSSSRSPRRSE